VILLGRTEKCLKETAEEITLSGTECHYFLCDVANREEVYKQAKVVREKVRPLSIHNECIPARTERKKCRNASWNISLCMRVGSELLGVPSGRWITLQP